jgi:Pyruvate/2-oxoacid:ferredoxin oxidoreductase delta subunit
MVLGKPDESGRPRPEPAKGDDTLFAIPCDLVLLALGQTPDRSLLPTSPSHGEAPPLEGTPTPLILAGDLATPQGTVAAAVGSGRQAARRLHAALSGAATPPGPAPLVDRSALEFRDVPRACMARGRVLPPRWRREGFLKIHRGLKDCDEASREAQRCFSCGACTACERCVAYCPEGVLSRMDEAGCTFDAAYCKGCGLCAAQCPRAALAMVAA